METRKHSQVDPKKYTSTRGWEPESSIPYNRIDNGATPTFRPRTKIYMAIPLIMELEVQRALEALNPNKSLLFPTL